MTTKKTSSLSVQQFGGAAAANPAWGYPTYYTPYGAGCVASGAYGAMSVALPPAPEPTSVGYEGGGFTAVATG